jgi:glutamine synthetase
MKGLFTISQLTEKVKAETIETVVVAFTDHYGRLMGKRFDAEFFFGNGR